MFDNRVGVLLIYDNFLLFIMRSLFKVWEVEFEDVLNLLGVCVCFYLYKIFDVVEGILYF